MFGYKISCLFWKWRQHWGLVNVRAALSHPFTASCCWRCSPDIISQSLKYRCFLMFGKVCVDLFQSNVTTATLNKFFGINLHEFVSDRIILRNMFSLFLEVVKWYFSVKTSFHICCQHPVTEASTLCVAGSHPGREKRGVQSRWEVVGLSQRRRHRQGTTRWWRYRFSCH